MLISRFCRIGIRCQDPSFGAIALVTGGGLNLFFSISSTFKNSTDHCLSSADG